MTNSIIQSAVSAVRAVSDLCTGLALVPPSVETTNCAIQDDNTAVTAAISAAEQAVQLAMDEVDGPELKALDYALDELRLAREAFFTNIPRNRVNASVNAENADRYMDGVGVTEAA